MKKFMETEWDRFEKMEDDVYVKTKSLWSQANADVRVRMLSTRWMKL